MRLGDDVGEDEASEVDDCALTTAAIFVDVYDIAGGEGGVTGAGVAQDVVDAGGADATAAAAAALFAAQPAPSDDRKASKGAGEGFGTAARPVVDIFVVVSLFGGSARGFSVNCFVQDGGGRRGRGRAPSKGSREERVKKEVRG